VLEEVLLEVWAVYPDSAWAVGGIPGDPYAVPVVDPSPHPHSEQYNGKSMNNKLHQHHEFSPRVVRRVQYRLILVRRLDFGLEGFPQSCFALLPFFYASWTARPL